MRPRLPLVLAALALFAVAFASGRAYEHVRDADAGERYSERHGDRLGGRHDAEVREREEEREREREARAGGHEDAEYAGASPLIVSPGHAVIHAGDVLELVWAEPPRNAEEMELLLSIDDGRHFPLRISPELEPDARRYRWRVPNLPTDAARIRVRIRLDEREVWMPVGERFEIVARPGAAIELDQIHEAGWWGGLDEHERDGARPADWHASSPRIATAVHEWLADYRTAWPLLPRVGVASSRILASSHPTPPARARAGGSPPQFVPARK